MQRPIPTAALGVFSAQNIRCHLMAKHRHLQEGARRAVRGADPHRGAVQPANRRGLCDGAFSGCPVHTAPTTEKGCIQVCLACFNELSVEWGVDEKGRAQEYCLMCAAQPSRMSDALLTANPLADAPGRARGNRRNLTCAMGKKKAAPAAAARSAALWTGSSRGTALSAGDASKSR